MQLRRTGLGIRERKEGMIGELVASTCCDDRTDAENIAMADDIVKACNNHDKFVQLAQMVAGRMYDDGVGHSAVQTAEELLDELGVEYMMKPQTRYIQKP